MTYTIDRNPEKYDLICSNATLDFYVSKTRLGGDWYTEAWIKGTNLCVTMGGFSTKKAAVECAHKWAEWMGR